MAQIQFKQGTPQYIIEAATELTRLDNDLKELNDEAAAVRKEKRKITALISDYVIQEESDTNTAAE